jgi:hypothetical protein
VLWSARPLVRTGGRAFLFFWAIMGKAIRIQAVDSDGKILHEFPSIAAASAAGHSHSTINRQICHNGKAVDGVLWRRVNGPKPSIDRLAVLIERLEAVANKFEGK